MINLHNAEKDKRNFQDETENMSEQTRELLSPLLNLPDFVLWHMVNLNFLFIYLFTYLFIFSSFAIILIYDFVLWNIIHFISFNFYFI